MTYNPLTLTQCFLFLATSWDYLCSFSERDFTGKDAWQNCTDHACISQNIFCALILDQSEASSILEQDLRDLLSLGAATKAFMLALVKTGRLKVAGKSIMFLNSA